VFDDLPPAVTDDPERVSRRRILVFSGALLLACAVSLAYVYLRPPEYRAVALMQISPPEMVAESNDGTKTPDMLSDPKSFATEVQVLTSRPLVGEAVRRLKAAGRLPDLGRDPVGVAQGMLNAVPLARTQIVQLAAVSPRQGLVSDLVNYVAQVYGQRLAKTYRERTAATIADVNDDARRLHEQVVAKQRVVDAFRDRYDIVSLDRTENEVLAKIDGLTRSYADSNAQVAKAEGHLESLRNALAAGKPIARPEDNAALGALEQQLTKLQDQKRELDRKYNPAYQVLDEDTKSLPAQIAELEQQIRDRRAVSGTAALAEAESELAGARTATAQLHKDLDDNQTEAHGFVGRLSAFKVMQDDLDHLQTMERAVEDRAAKLQSSVRERAPHIGLLEAAAPALTPWRPNYGRDALIALAGSVLFALLATLLAEYLHGPAPVRRMLVHHALAFPSLGRASAPALDTLAAPLLGAPRPASLPPPAPPPRPPENREIAAMIATAPDTVRVAVLALLTGLDASEIAALRWDQIDFAGSAIAVGGAYARRVGMQSALSNLLAKLRDGAPDAAAPVLRNDRGEALTAEELDRLISYAAFDAGLSRPQDITAMALRNSYLGFLLRQGIRATDIGRIAGHVPAEEMAAYMQRAAPGARLPLEQVDRVHPVLRGPAVPG